MLNHGKAFKQAKKKAIILLPQMQEELKRQIIQKESMAIALLAAFMENGGHIEISAESYAKARKIIETKGVARPHFFKRQDDPAGFLIAFPKTLLDIEPTQTALEQSPRLPIQEPILEDEKESKVDPYAEGVVAFRMGKGVQACPHELGSAEYNSWCAGYNDATREPA